MQPLILTIPLEHFHLKKKLLFEFKAPLMTLSIKLT